MQMRRLAGLVFSLTGILALSGCKDYGAPPTIIVDAGHQPDAGSMDAGSTDAGPVVDAGSTDAGPVVDAGPGGNLVGTWISHLTTTGTITAPLLSTEGVTVDVIQRMVVTVGGGQITSHFQICSLSTTSLPSAPTPYMVTYPQIALDTFQVTQGEPAQTVNVGDMVPVPNFQILSGWDASMNPVDSDGDGDPGISVVATLTSGATMINLPTDIGITINTSLTGTLSDPNTITGMVAFGTTGLAFAINGASPCNPYPSCAQIIVTTDQPMINFTATRLAGDVPCSQVIAMFP